MTDIVIPPVTEHTDKPPKLTDPGRLAQNRARATAEGMFLQELAIDEIQDRLDMVNRAFTDVAIVTGFPEIWSAAFPNAKIVPDDERLALEPGTHDLVIHAMGLHWANDPIGQMVQSRLALKPDGLFLGVCFGGQTLAELRAVLAETESRIFGGLSPRVAPMGEIRDMGALLQRAGYALPVADSTAKTVTYSDIFALMKDLRLMGERNALAARNPTPLPRGFFDAADQHYKQHFPAEQGRILASFEFITLTGWVPDDSQPKPLRPGSAAARLADALGTDEKKLME
ncbi:SAM-dependent methyltransferase [Aliiroseovarius sp. KMU-50]|uniref:SAM-dependent methyltransferase n=1 Tax=Aliiroseovarius salicola TaxID=3009082 RepID=A0ABT4VZP1_9RHOB|nr:SAM-dependent methyltransferase [Aliiroseovarius sp. KMU-50]MDA5093003.1 SAM-dependent methyltransferase [Aliiroseovarius sp. KMU-50]